MRHRQREGARRRPWVVILLCQCVGGFAIRSDAERERRAVSWRLAAIESVAEGSRSDRARCPSCRTTRGRRARRGRRDCARDQETALDRFPTRPRPWARPSRLTRMEGPRRRLLSVAAPSMTEERRAGWQVFGFDEQFAKCRMGEVGGRRREDDLGIAGDFDLADRRTVVPDRNPRVLRRRLPTKPRCRVAWRCRRPGAENTRDRRRTSTT